MSYLGQRSESAELTELCVHLPDKRIISLRIIQGTKASAKELVYFLFNELKLPADHLELFSLFLLSPSLELQLKPDHVVYDVIMQWPDLLYKYANMELSQVLEHPILMFARNIFYPVERERELEHETLIELLYAEAAQNVMDGRYPCEDSDHMALAGLKTHIIHGPYNAGHNDIFYKGAQEEVLPDFVRTRRSGFFKRNTLISELRDAHATVAHQLTDQSATAARRAFLAKCWQLPLYGSAFFSAYIKFAGGTVLPQREMVVLVAINSRGVYILDPDHQSLLLGLSHRQFSWEFRDGEGEEASSSGPTIYLMFRVREEGDRSNHKIVTLYSKQCPLINALLSTQSQLFSLRYRSSLEEEGTYERQQRLINPDNKVWSNKHKLLRLPSFHS